MYQMNAEIRDKNVKAKKLRKNGMVPACIYGKDLENEILLQIAEGDARKLLKYKGKGGKVEITCQDTSYEVILKEIQVNQYSNFIEDLCFQKVEKGQTVNSVARIILKNKNKTQALIHLLTPEIPYTAVLENMVEEIELDMAKIRTENIIKVSDLDIWNKEEIEVLVPGETIVVRLVASGVS